MKKVLFQQISHKKEVIKMLRSQICRKKSSISKKIIFNIQENRRGKEHPKKMWKV